MTQRTTIDVDYNYVAGVGNQGHLHSSLTELAERSQAWFDSLPNDAYGAIMRTILALDPGGLDAGEPAAIVTIKGKLKSAVANDVDLAWGGDTVTATMGDTQVAEFEFIDYDDDGKMWVLSMETENNAVTGQTWRRLGLGLMLLAEAMTHFNGEVYASSGSKLEHDPDDDGDDTRWLTPNGAQLINAAVAQGVLPGDHFYNPIAAADVGMEGSGSEEDWW